MDLLIDTHVFIWWDSSDPRLGGVAAAAISDPKNRVFVSAASIWEIAVKQQAGRLAFKGSPSKAVAANGFRPLPISGDHAEAAAKLPPIHQDPFDRILIAQALDRQLVLVTADGLINRYAVPLLSAEK
jgi:PIN domain nuclease of toxin-antitoxin system